MLQPGTKIRFIMGANNGLTGVILCHSKDWALRQDDTSVNTESRLMNRTDYSEYMVKVDTGEVRAFPSWTFEVVE